MAEKTKIAWTNSVFNPWLGCTKVGPGCDHCYAEAMDSRRRWDGGKTHWGAGVPRYRTSASNWKQPIAWNKKAAASGKPWRVFCASLADVFDNEVPQQWRDDLWDLILATPNLDWLLVTKRIGNVIGRVPVSWLSKSAADIRNFTNGGGTFPMDGKFPPNVRILITVCNQEEADRDLPKLLALPCKNGISYEPALGLVDWSRRNSRGMIEWVIVGGESGPKARFFNVEWAYSTIGQCKAAGTACFVKQLGSNCGYSGCRHEWFQGRHDRAAEVGYNGVRQLKDRAGANPDEWPADLRVRQFPE